MQTITMVRLTTRHEREVIQKATVHVRIAVPNLDTLDERDEDRRAFKALRSCGTGDTMNRDRLLLAEALLDALVDTCHVESERDWWERLLTPQDAALANAVTTPGAVGLIAPGADVIGVLTEARELQAREAQAALDLVRDMLSNCPATPVTEDD